MKIITDAFRPNGEIPRRYTREGDDRSRPLWWKGLPERTESLALIVEDPDAPRGTFTHWLMWDIPITLDHLTEQVSHAGEMTDGSRQGENDFGEHGYSGPMPPRGSKPHHYHFKLFALDTRLRLE